MALPGETVARLMDEPLENGTSLDCPDCGVSMPLAVQHSAAGYYLGFFCGLCGPYSRESGYFRRREEAQNALETGEWERR